MLGDSAAEGGPSSLERREGEVNRQRWEEERAVSDEAFGRRADCDGVELKGADFVRRTRTFRAGRVEEVMVVWGKEGGWTELSLLRGEIEQVVKERCRLENCLLVREYECTLAAVEEHGISGVSMSWKGEERERKRSSATR